MAAICALIEICALPCAYVWLESFANWNLAEIGIMKAGTSITTILALILSLLVLPAIECQAATGNLVVTQTNPNGVPATGNQYLLSVQITGATGPTFLGTDAITFSGALGQDEAPGAFAAQPSQFYSGPHVLFQSEADLANSIDAANYARRDDSYFASAWRTLLPSPLGAGETATTLMIEGGAYGAAPYMVAGNGTYPFAYINVLGSAGIEIQGAFAIGSEAVEIGEGAGLKLTLGGELVSIEEPTGDHNGDGAVDAADYVAWRKNPEAFGGDPGGYDTWRQMFGGEGGGTGGTSVPEPSTLGLLVIAIGGNPRVNGWHGACGDS
jgi:hypothetical protein